MINTQKLAVTEVIGPLGTLLTLNDLPPPGARWTARRKAEIVTGVIRGLLSRQEACDRYAISIEEFTEWSRGFELSGFRGLHVTRAQSNRQVLERLQR